MGKISPVVAKYIVTAVIDIDGVVDKPDVIGAIFGQTEGLLGADLELRELQRSGRIGRIEVNTDTRGGKTRGEIIIPSSLDKAETAIIAAAMEIIQRIGPCNSRIKVEKVEDVRVTKRRAVIERAKEILKKMQETLPDSQELSEEVAYSVRVMEIQEYGRERLPSGPDVNDSEEIIIVERSADVVNLLKQGCKNAIAINGTSVPETIKELTKSKEVTVFVDGDRGGDLIIRELLAVAKVDFVAKAPAGKEVEEITQKEIHQALRNRIAADQAKQEIRPMEELRHNNNLRPLRNPRFEPRRDDRKGPPMREIPAKKAKLSTAEKTKFNEVLEELVGTRGAYMLDSKLNILGKVPITELSTTLKSVGTGVHAVLLDGAVDKDITETAERFGIQFVVGTKAEMKSERINILTPEDL